MTGQEPKLGRVSEGLWGGWGSVAGDFQAPVVQDMNVSGFHVCHKEDPLTIRVHAVERTEERRARVRVQHIVGLATRPSGAQTLVNTPGIGVPWLLLNWRR